MFSDEGERGCQTVSDSVAHGERKNVGLTYAAADARKGDLTAPVLYQEFEAAGVTRCELS